MIIMLEESLLMFGDDPDIDGLYSSIIYKYRRQSCKGYRRK